MKRNQFYVWSLSLTALVLAGCDRKPGESAAGEATVEIGPKYSAKNGLHVPEETRLSLGLKTVEVTEQKIPATLDLPLRIYRSSATTLFASGAVTPEQAKVLKAGQAAQVFAGDGRKLPGKITGVTGELQKATGTAEVLVEIAHGAETLMVGAFVPASVALEREESVVTIPRAALLECSDGHSVYTVSGESYVRTPVKVGATGGELVEIKDGLYAGDQVVLQPVMSLWMTELAAVKGGQACCVLPAKGK